MHYGGWNDGGGIGWMWVPMIIMMIAFWGGLAWVVVALVRRPNHALHAGPSGIVAAPAETRPTAQEILAERLARGEIEPDEYQRRLGALHTPSGSSSP